MKQLIIVVICMALIYAESTNELDTVLQLITDLKNNVQLEIDALDAAWEMHKNNQQSVVDALAASEGEQRNECYKKDQEVESKKRDIQITTNYIDWMFKRQSLNNQRISILEANRCQQNNNYIHDIKNYKIAISLVQFLRSQIDKLSDTTSLIQKQEFLQSVSKFLKIYHTGKLINMIETLQQEDGTFIIPDIKDDEEDMSEMALTQSRGKQQQQSKSFLQMKQKEDDDEKADNAVVLIPGGCDDSIQTVVVVQNDDGTNDNDDDMKITFTNGGGQGKPKIHTDPKPRQPAAEVAEVAEEESEGEGEEATVAAEEETQAEASEEEGGEDIQLGEESEEEQGDDGKETGEEEQQHTDSTDTTDHTPIVDEGITDTIDKPEEPTAPTKDEDEDFPNTIEGLKKLLDAIEKHSRKSLDLGSGDEIRSAMTYIDFKIHIELENGTFDKHIANEKENLVKLNNQLTTRQQVANQCNARLKQISIAYKVYLEV